MMKREDKNMGGMGGERGGHGGGRDGGGMGGDKGGEKRSFGKKRGCRFCSEMGQFLTFKDKNLLNNFITERYKIIPRRITGLCAGHQRQLATEIKRSRHIAIIPYSSAQL